MSLYSIATEYNGPLEAAHAHIDDERYDKLNCYAASKPAVTHWTSSGQLLGCSIASTGAIRLQGSEWNRWETLTKDANVCRSGSDSNSFTHILNGCPRQTYIKYARKAMALSDDPKFLMLVRDPVDRYISFLNDSVRRGGSRMNIEESAKLRSGPGISLVKQGVQLKNLLSVVKDPKQILVIPMESLSLNAEGVIDAIMDHVEGRRWKRNETEVKNPGSMKMNVGSTDKYKYVHLSYNTTEMLRNEFRQDALLLESLVGKRFSWSSWARKDDDSNSAGGNEEQKGEFWLVTSPASG